MVLPFFLWNHAFIRHSLPSSVIGNLICDGRKRLFDLHHSAMLFIQNTCDFFESVSIDSHVFRTKLVGRTSRCLYKRKCEKRQWLSAQFLGTLETGRSTTVAFRTSTTIGPSYQRRLKFIAADVRLCSSEAPFVPFSSRAWNICWILNDLKT